MLVYFNGLLLGLSLLLALGPQNIFLIRQGVLRKHAFLSAFTCFICDVTLISMSVIGLNKILERHPKMCLLLSIFGGMFLLGYGARSVWYAMNYNHQKISTNEQDMTKKQIIFFAIGFSLLNPHAILDSLILIGGNSGQYPDQPGTFLMGVLTSSLIWFSVLTSSAYFFAEALMKPKIWKRVEWGSGLILIGLGFQLLLKVYQQNI
tara:strand:- start:593 stop:1210 length:618 start_codon:yes stop_codon:yes gene_type:complete